MGPSLRMASWLTKDGTHLVRAGMSPRVRPSLRTASWLTKDRAHLVRVGLSRRYSAQRTGFAPSRCTSTAGSMPTR
jgi:hypothetical protein